MNIELYIQGERVDLFKDESISLTDSIQNVRDIAKVFTAFSKSFNLPSSKTNNKIFKHYYNFDIVNGFDARKKVDAVIELNNLPFKTGKIKLDGVSLKNNKPNTYKITFFGDIVELKDKVGEDKLNDLDFTQYDLDYDATEMQTRLTTEESANNHIVAPLITHSQRLFYDSAVHEPNDGNLYWKSGGGTHNHGVKWNELKYAIRVNKIIEAIETDYDLEFSNDFFKNTNVREFDKMFLWLHRKSGKVEDLSGETNLIETRINEWTPQYDQYFEIENGYFTVKDSTGIDRFILSFLTNSTDSYNIRVEFNRNVVYSRTGQVGNISLSGIGNNADLPINTGYYEVYISSETAIPFTNIIWEATYINDTIPNDPDFEDIAYGTGAFTTSSTFKFNVSKQMPDIKILDFLTGLFKLFNLTAYLVDGVIKVQPLDSFYENFNTYDITKYIEIDSSSVDVALPYKEVDFKFKDTKTFLANKYGEIVNKDWGSISYNDDSNDLSGSLYKIEVPFSKMLFERLINASNSQDKRALQWGYSVDKSQNAYLGSPLLFYPKYVATGSFSFVNQVDIENIATNHIQLTNANVPSSSVSFSYLANDSQLSFYNETNEWTGGTRFEGTLFNKYYKSYIQDTFNTKQRITKISAYLPLRILLNYKLADRFIINDNVYKINSITTNLEDGKSNIELLNDL
jgi:hypothetical protein